MVQTVHHPVAGDVRFVARPIRFEDRAPGASMPPPTLGQHTFEVFADWLSWTRADVARMAARGAFGEAQNLEA
jgi:formyl-CoA transferase